MNKIQVKNNVIYVIKDHKRIAVRSNKYVTKEGYVITANFVKAVKHVR